MVLSNVFTVERTFTVEFHFCSHRQEKLKNAIFQKNQKESSQETVTVPYVREVFTNPEASIEANSDRPIGLLGCDQPFLDFSVHENS